MGQRFLLEAADRGVGYTDLFKKFELKSFQIADRPIVVLQIIRQKKDFRSEFL